MPIFIDIGELIAMRCIDREESCGGHFPKKISYRRRRSKNVTTNCLRMFLAGSTKAKKAEPVLHKEALKFENIKLSQRSYKKCFRELVMRIRKN